MKILLTGATGNLGSHIARNFISKGHEVVALIRNKSKLKNLKDIQDKITCVNYRDIDNAKFYKQNQIIDVFIHAATCYGREGESIEEIYEINVVKPLKLLAKLSRKIEYFINIDTMLEKETSSYALTKKKFRVSAKKIVKESKMVFKNIRIVHLYGIKNSIVDKIIDSQLNQHGIKITKAEQQLDFIHITDAVNAIEMITNQIGDKKYDEYEVGSGEVYILRDVVNFTVKKSKKRSFIKLGAIDYRANETMYLRANTSKIKKIGWNKKIKIYEWIDKQLSIKKCGK